MRFKIFRASFALLLISGYLLGILNSFVPFAEYYLNYDYIVENLCIERDIEDSECDGKCHLEVEIEEQEEQEQNPVAPQLPEIKQFTPHLLAVGIQFPRLTASEVFYSVLSQPSYYFSPKVLTPPPKTVT